MEKIMADIEKFGKLEFIKASDGWYEYIPAPIGHGISLAINPEKTVCITDPWYADYICDAPEHKIISVEEK